MGKPIPNIPINVAVSPDARTYTVSLLLALISGLLFGIVPVRQVLRVDPWQSIKAGASSDRGGGRLALRDLLIAAQIAICGFLGMAALVGVRGIAVVNREFARRLFGSPEKAMGPQRRRRRPRREQGRVHLLPPPMHVYQATPRDPVVLGGVVGGMVLLGLVAGWIPPQRALRLDPLILLREE